MHIAAACPDLISFFAVLPPETNKGVCQTTEWPNWLNRMAELAGGSGNEASGGEMEYDGRVANIGVSAGKEGNMGRSGQIGGGGKRGVLM
jgi:hypothetical protein